MNYFNSKSNISRSRLDLENLILIKSYITGFYRNKARTMPNAIAFDWVGCDSKCGGT